MNTAKIQEERKQKDDSVGMHGIKNSKERTDEGIDEAERERGESA